MKNQKVSPDIAKLSARKSAELIRNGKLDPLEVFDFHDAQISKLNPSLNAHCYYNKDKAHAKAKELSTEAKAGKIRGRLHGLAFSLKDSFNLEGYPQSDGTKYGSTEKSTSTSALVQKLLDEGAYCIGKANMAERGRSYITTNPLYGRTKNPFNLEHSPGGSGGGDSAAIAAGFAQFGLGADAGGSVRVPANFCGLFGLFPTRGLITDANYSHVIHTFANLFRNAGPLAKSLDDLEILYKILSFYDARDAYSVERPQSNYSSAKKKKIAFFTEINGVSCENEIKDAVHAAAKTFESHGYEIEEKTPGAFRAAYEVFILLAGQANLILEDTLGALSGKPRNPDDDGEIMKTLRQRIASELPPASLEVMLASWHHVDQQRVLVAKTFEEYEHVLCPVVAMLPPKHDASYIINGVQYQSQQVFQFASMVNTLALPSIAFPTGTSSSGLPIGLQLIGPRFSEQRLFDALRTTGFKERKSFIS